MRLRSSLDLELRPLLKALKKRMEDLREVSSSKKNGWEVFLRGEVEFMHLETRRDHMNLDLWLPADEILAARGSGIAKPHPFDEGLAIRVRFERAEDLTTVARWVEQAHTHAKGRTTSPTKKTAKKASNGNGARKAASKPRTIARSTSSPLANGVPRADKAKAETKAKKTASSRPRA